MKRERERPFCSPPFRDLVIYFSASFVRSFAVSGTVVGSIELITHARLFTTRDKLHVVDDDFAQK